MRYKGFELYPFQEQAIQSIERGHSVIVSAPTGAGKTVIAEYAIDTALRNQRRIVYTSPIKALSNQKYRDFMESYGDDKVGIMTGDVTINPTAPILIMTTEIFRNTIFEDVKRLDNIDYLVFDEVHYLGDPDRGSVWEETIIFAPPNIRFIALSATIGNLDELTDWMTSIRDTHVDLVHTSERPVPLHRFLFLDEPGIFEPKDLKQNLTAARQKARTVRHHHRDRRGGRHRPPQRKRDLIRILVRDRRMPLLYFSFSRRKCETLARRYQKKLKLLEPDEERRVLKLFDDLVERYGAATHPATPVLREHAQRGVLYHHAGIMPIFKDIVERLFCSGLVKLLFTTETFALGVNMPARCVVFDSLWKFDGVDMKPMSSLSFRQMAGRAGRQGIDTEGEVYAILDPERDTPKIVNAILHKNPGAVISQFDLGYATTLNLKRLMGDRIEEAVKKSFSAFQRKSPKHAIKSLQQALTILQGRSYLDEEGLTGKGRFCTRLAGFEIHLTELFWEGCFEDLDPLQCALLAASIVYEERSRGGPPQRIQSSTLPSPVVNRATKRLRAFRRSESQCGREHLLKPLDFGLSLVLEAWMMGDTFQRLRGLTNMQDGDLVRAFRLTIQVLRQLSWALPKDHHVSDACRTAIQLINRDEVDAEKQLRCV